MATLSAEPAPSTPPRTPPRNRPVTATLSDGTSVKCQIDHKESDVPIFMSDRFVPLEASDAPITMVPVGEKFPGAFVLQNFLSASECADMVQCAEAMGFEAAKVTTGRGMVSIPDLRSNERVIWHTGPGMLEPLTERLLPFLQRPEVADLLPGWTPYALNERLRLFKYSKGQEFRKHFDGGYNRNRFDRSHMTFIAYLGTPEEGGDTGFYDDAGSLHATVPAKKGNALVFFHQNHHFSPLHSGMPVLRGTKYAVRSDIMFSKSPPLSTTVAGEH